MPVFIRILLFLSLFMFSISHWANAQETLMIGLDEALSLNQKAGYQNIIARTQVRKAKGTNWQAWQGMLPQVSLEENFLRTNDPVAVFSGKLRQEVFAERDFSTATLNRPSPIEWYTTALTLKMPLFNADFLLAKFAAGKAVTAARYQADRMQSYQEFLVQSTYWDLALAWERDKAIARAVASAKAHRDNASAARSSGLLTEADYLWTEVRLAELQEQKIDAANQIHDVSDHLKLLTGLHTEARLLQPGDSLGKPSIVDADSFKLRNLERRSDIKALSQALAAKKYQLASIKTSWLPRINGFAQRNWYGKDIGATDARNWSVGVNLSWQLFDGMGRWGKYQFARAEVEAQEAELAATLQQADNELNMALRAIGVAEERYEVALLTWRQAKESLRLTSERFAEGLEKSSTVIEREAGVTAANLRVLNAKREYIISQAKLSLVSQ